MLTNTFLTQHDTKLTYLTEIDKDGTKTTIYPTFSILWIRLPVFFHPLNNHKVNGTTTRSVTTSAKVTVT